MDKQYYCLGCGAPLHSQKNFDDSNGTWICTTCSRLNDLSYESTQGFNAFFVDSSKDKDDIETADNVDDAVEVIDDNNPADYKRSIQKFEFDEDNDEDEVKQEVAVIDDEEQKVSYKEKINTFLKKNTDNLKMSAPKVKKDWFSFLIISFLVIVIIIMLYFFLQFRKLTSVGIASENIGRYSYVEVVEQLQDQGFTNITIVPVYDLKLTDINKDYKVKDIKIGGKSEFSSTTKFLCDEEIVITYSTLEEIHLGLSSKDVKRYNYETLVKILEKKGFVNIEVLPIHDLTFGWFVKDGDVDTMIINDIDNYDIDDKFRPDARIVISYHTYKE